LFKKFELENVASANALQLGAARRHAVPVGSQLAEIEAHC